MGQWLGRAGGWWAPTKNFLPEQMPLQSPCLLGATGLRYLVLYSGRFDRLGLIAVRCGAPYRALKKG